MATTNLGKVSVTPKGEYDPLITYERLDIINHNGSSYIVKQTSTGVTPIDGEFYALIAEKGDGGSFVKKAYKTYTAMDADKVNIPANSSVDVTNDPDESKNGAYIYDGVAFTRSQYDSKVVTDKIIADTAVAVASAIEGVAIDANLVTDALIVTDGNTTQRTINRGLQDVAAMQSLSSPENGQRVFVNGEQGGWFVYDLSKISVNDGGYTLNGWVRQVEGERLTPQMFGAKADGVTFDTKAIMDCIASARDNNKVIWMGGSENAYLVKHTNPKDEFNYIFNITEGFKMRGDGATIKVNQSSLPDFPNAQYALFRIDRPFPFITTYQYLTKGIEFEGVKLDGGYVFANDTERGKLQDKHKLRAINAFEVRLQDMRIYNCEFHNFSQNNTIATFFSSSFDTYGVGKGITVDKCKFVNNGYEGDHSTLYFMDDNVSITRCSFHLDKEVNSFGSHVAEFHGKNSNMDWCAVDNYLGGLIFGTNTQTGAGLLGGCSAMNNVMRVYSDAFSIWSGEVPNENGLDSIKIGWNTATLMDYDGRLLEKMEVNSDKAFLSTPIVGKILGSVSAQNNTIISESVKKVYGADISVGGGIQPEIIDFSNNTLKGCQSCVRVSTRSGVTGNIYNNIKVNGNNHYHYEDKGAFNVVEIATSNDNENTIKSISASANTVSTFNPSNCILIDVKSGNVENITVGDNSLPQGSRVLSLNGFNNPLVSSTQKLGVTDYFAVPEASAVTITPSIDTIVFKIPLSEMDLAVGGLSLSKSLGFLAKNTYLVRVLGSLSGGFPTSGIDVSSDFRIGTRNIVAGATISNAPKPVWGGEVGFDVAYSDNATKLISISFGTYDAATVTALKNSGLVLTCEVTVRKSL